MAVEEAEEKEQLLVELEVGVEPTCNGIGYGYGDGDVTCFLIFSVSVAICGSFVTGCAAGYSSPVQSAILTDLDLSMADYSLFASIIMIGQLLGSLMCGKMTDYIGCRATMWLADVLYLAGWLAIAFAQAALLLDLGRLLLGFANALIYYVVAIYIAEISPKNLRGGLILLSEFMQCFGVALFFLIGIITPWRILALIGTIPCIIQLLGIFFIPESPRWLVKVGNGEGCEAALQRLRGENKDISEEATAIKEYIEALQNMSEAHFFNLFEMKYAYAFTVSLGLMALSSLTGGSGILFYTTSVFESAGFSATVGTAAMALFQCPPIALGVFLMDKLGRRPLLMYSAAGMCITCLSLASSFYLKEHGWLMDFSPYLALIGVLISCASFPVGMGCIPFVIMSEIFPANIKGKAGSLAIAVRSFTSWCVSYTFSFMMNWSSSGTFFIYMSINFFSILFVAKLVPETKGRTLEEIQESITHILH